MLRVVVRIYGLNKRVGGVPAACPNATWSGSPSAASIALLLWKVPETFIRHNALITHFGPLLDVENQIVKNYVEEVDQKALLHGAIDGMLSRLDPYSQYFDEAESEQFQKFTEGQFPGIGIEVGPLPGGGVVVVSPIEGSPAFYAGLRGRPDHRDRRKEKRRHGPHQSGRFDQRQARHQRQP